LSLRIAMRWSSSASESVRFMAVLLAHNAARRNWFKHRPASAAVAGLFTLGGAIDGVDRRPVSMSLIAPASALSRAAQPGSLRRPRGRQPCARAFFSPGSWRRSEQNCELIRIEIQSPRAGRGRDFAARWYRRSRNRQGSVRYQSRNVV
jgi:hypothetical protein